MVSSITKSRYLGLLASHVPGKKGEVLATDHCRHIRCGIQERVQSNQKIRGISDVEYDRIYLTGISIWIVAAFPDPQ